MGQPRCNGSEIVRRTGFRIGWITSLRFLTFCDSRWFKWTLRLGVRKQTFRRLEHKSWCRSQAHLRFVYAATPASPFSPLVECIWSRLLRNRVWWIQVLEYNIQIIHTITLNGGSLDSWVDEERQQLIAHQNVNCRPDEHWYFKCTLRSTDAITRPRLAERRPRNLILLAFAFRCLANLSTASLEFKKVITREPPRECCATYEGMLNASRSNTRSCGNWLQFHTRFPYRVPDVVWSEHLILQDWGKE